MHAHVLEQNLFVLGQGRALLRELDPSVYEARDPVARASPGAHLRHCLDAYRCFLRDQPSGRVDYDCRQRDPEVERDPSVAAAWISQILERLPELAGELDRSLIVRSDCDGEEGEEGGGWTPSTVGFSAPAHWGPEGSRVRPVTPSALSWSKTSRRLTFWAWSEGLMGFSANRIGVSG